MTISKLEYLIMVTAVISVVGFSMFIAATWFYGQQEDQA
jgi:hypothetical protein